MRISDWSSDVCSSDLSSRFPDAPPFFSRQSEIEKSARSNNVDDRREVARPAGRLWRHGKRRAGAGRHRCRTVSLRRLIELGLCYGVASGAGYLFIRLDMQLPWMIGPLIATALLGLVARPIDLRSAEHTS